MTNPTISDIIADMLAWRADQFDAKDQWFAVPGKRMGGDEHAAGLWRIIRAREGLR